MFVCLYPSERKSGATIFVVVVMAKLCKTYSANFSNNFLNTHKSIDFDRMGTVQWLLLFSFSSLLLLIKSGELSRENVDLHVNFPNENNNIHKKTCKFNGRESVVTILFKLAKDDTLSTGLTLNFFAVVDLFLRLKEICCLCHGTTNKTKIINEHRTKYIVRLKIEFLCCSSSTMDVEYCMVYTTNKFCFAS